MKFKSLIHVALVGFLLAISMSSFAADEVRLAWAQVQKDPMTPGGYCPSCVSFFGEIEVKNIAYTKQVNAWYRIGTGAWISSAAKYDAGLSNGKQAWDFVVSLGYVYPMPSHIELKFSYKVNGVTYWDTNNGSNYHIGLQSTQNPPSVLGTANLFMDNVNGSYGSFNGSVIVKNIAYNKQVKITYSTDGWKTKKSTLATYGWKESAKAEGWNWALNLVSPPTTFFFYVSYTVNGVTYIDSNHGRNYGY